MIRKSKTFILFQNFFQHDIFGFLQWIWKCLKEIFLLHVFPPSCVGCGKEDSLLCPICFQKIALLDSQFCPYCFSPSVSGKICHTCSRDHPFLDALIVSCFYEKKGLLAKALARFKYHFSAEMGLILSQLLYLSFRKQSTSILNRESPFYAHSPPHSLPHVFSETSEIQDFSTSWVVSSVPLHPTRKKWRGFNQAEILASSFASSVNLPYVPLLRRSLRHIPQALLTKEERLKSMKGAFEACFPESFFEKNVILVDDIATTLSTLEEAAKVLKQHGIKSVCGLILGRGSWGMVPGKNSWRIDQRRGLCRIDQGRSSAEILA